MKNIYLDNNATTQVAPEVIYTMIPFYENMYGNPGSNHELGRKVRRSIDIAREQVAQFIGAKTDEIVFTSGGSESDNTAIWSYIRADDTKKKIVISAVEHPAVKNLCIFLSSKGYKITEVPVDENGRLDMDFYKHSLDKDTALVSLMWANNETGVLFPIEDAAYLANEQGIPFHTDAVQAVGKTEINLKDTYVNMLSLSGHKFHAPKGIGVLYVKRGSPYHSLIMGGNQENGRRAGTENCAGIVGLGKACELAATNLKTRIKMVKKLRDYFEKKVKENINGIKINGEKTARLPNTSSISFEGIDANTLLTSLDNNFGIYASSGAACHAGSKTPSYVLSAMGISDKMALGTVRFSLSIYNTEEEIEFVIDKLKEEICRMRK